MSRARTRPRPAPFDEEALREAILEEELRQLDRGAVPVPPSLARAQLRRLRAALEKSR